MLATKTQQNDLINGYIKEQSKQTRCNIPLCIVQLFFKFYNTLSWITFKDAKLQDFIATPKGQWWEAPAIKFPLHQIQILPILCPLETRDILKFDTLIKPLMTNRFVNVKSVTYSLRFYCPETKTFYVISYGQDASKLEDEYRYPKFEDQYRFEYPIDNRDIYMLLNKCKDKQTVTFGFEINILTIEYHEGLSTRIYHSPSIRTMQMKQKFEINYEWKKDNPQNIPFLSYFDNHNYALTLNNEIFCLKLLKMPPGVGSVECLIEGTVNDDLTTNTICVHKLFKGNWTNKRIATSYRCYHMNIKICLTVEIVGLIHKQRLDDIPIEQWAEYGIIQ